MVKQDYWIWDQRAREQSNGLSVNEVYCAALIAEIMNFVFIGSLSANSSWGSDTNRHSTKLGLFNCSYLGFSNPMLHKSKINSNHKTLLAGAVAQATAKIGEEHKEQTGTLQQLADRLTALMGQPLFIVALFMAILVWVVGNLTVVRLGYAPIDPPPFIWLQGTITTSTLFIAVLILTTQRREDQLANHRLQLILELTILNDQRSSKIIELLEEVRRDNPAIFDRVDNEAAAMSVPSDTLAVLEAIKDSGTKL